ncbi:hypothetical protein GNIT_3571 [Glaciecola nitratireducens FR1064]|uniref:Uncharacterized protein n=1 Tax=Glaciecola nitratireducens (strain JCM 12485 / KCTC 12276 / FR1064) TaxID=1085623 RepID=G4QNV7_GLANF|nr:hypothetical protein GNIT_3571 [Glaciecola nitratireducens FR1064]
MRQSMLFSECTVTKSAWLHRLILESKTAAGWIHKAVIEKF